MQPVENTARVQSRVQTHYCSRPRELCTCWPTVVEGAVAEDGMATLSTKVGPAAEHSAERTGEAGLRISELAAETLVAAPG